MIRVVPYRLDVDDPPDRALDALIDLGALDVEATGAGLAALMPDAVPPEIVTRALGTSNVHVSPAAGRDDESVWTLTPRRVRTRTLEIVPAGMPAPASALRLADSRAFGSGLHATTRLCLEALEDLFDTDVPACVLDVGTGSGILALAALRRGVPRAVGLDIDAASLRVAAENALLNDLAGRLSLVRGGADAVRGSWPLVVANIRAAELMEMASALVRRVARSGRLVLSGIPRAIAGHVEQSYRRLGMVPVESRERDGWTALVLRPSW